METRHTSSLFGVGIDVADLPRIKNAMRDPGFLAHVLTPYELSTAPDAQRLAGIWAAKEAVAKAVGTHLRWHDVEILEESSVRFAPGVAPEDLSVQLSISVSADFALAVAIAERRRS
jgi:phosphopantetheine--protein transferase-like protein